jgi:hypothetical protein
MQYLLSLMREQDHRSGIDDAECSAALSLAEAEHVLPWIAARFRARSTPLPPALSTCIDQIKHDAAITAFYWSSELKGVLRALEQSDVQAIPLKGPFLAERLYGNVALRVSRDLDILVSKSDLPRAEAILAANGFAPGPSDDYHRPWRRQSMTLELHHDVENPLAFDFHIESAIRRATSATFQGAHCWQLAAEDELLFLCLHAARHHYERLSLIFDLQLAFEKLPATTAGWHPRTEVAALNHLLTLGLAMARRLQPDLCIAPEVADSIPPSPRLEKLADRLWWQLLTRPSESLDWTAAHSFFLEIESPGWPRFHRRVQHLRILAARTIEPDYAFAARFGLRRSWQVRLLRPVRILVESVSR